jgi:hypothetical protein
LAHFGTADVVNECAIIEQKQTLCVLTFVTGKTCKQTVAHGRLVVGAIEMTWLFAPRLFLILSEFLAA